MFEPDDNKRCKQINGTISILEYLCSLWSYINSSNLGLVVIFFFLTCRNMPYNSFNCVYLESKALAGCRVNWNFELRYFILKTHR